MTNDTETNITTDRETIRTWADERDARPAFRTDESGTRRPHVLHSGEDPSDSVEETTWDEFYESLDENELAFVRHGDREEGRGEFEVVDRAKAVERATLEDEEVEEALLEGETVRSEVVETRVIEKEVVETETIESEIIDSKVVSDDVVASELVQREIVGIHVGEGRDVTIVEDDTVRGHEEATEYFGQDEVITLEVDETRDVTREIVERKVVESRVVDVDVEEHETLESESLEGHVDLEGVHRTIVHSDIFSGEMSLDEAIDEGHIESEFTEEATIETELFERRTVEDTVVDRKRLTFELVDEELVESETIESVEVESELLGSTDIEQFTERGTMAETTDTMASTETTETTTDETETGAVALHGDDVGKRVTDASGNKVGVVTEVDEASNTMYVDPNPGLAERIKTRLGWEGHDDDAYSVGPDNIDRVGDDEVHLKDL